jgi:hypothetical protein
MPEFGRFRTWLSVERRTQSCPHVEALRSASERRGWLSEDAIPASEGN